MDETEHIGANLSDKNIAFRQQRYRTKNVAMIDGWDVRVTYFTFFKFIKIGWSLAELYWKTSRPGRASEWASDLWNVGRRKPLRFAAHIYRLHRPIQNDSVHQHGWLHLFRNNQRKHFTAIWQSSRMHFKNAHGGNASVSLTTGRGWTNPACRPSSPVSSSISIIC